MISPAESDIVTRETKDAVEHGKNIRKTVRNITLNALKRGKLDTQGTKRVIHSVIQGASLGVNKAGDKSLQALSDAMAGLDDALAKSAEATRLAIEEAAGRLRDFSKNDLEKSFDDLRTLEGMFLDTLKEVADQSTNEARKILQGMLQHARNSGTEAGRSAKSALASLELKLGRTLHEVIAAGTEVAQGAGANLAEAAAGFLAGFAEALDAKARSLRKEKK